MAARCRDVNRWRLKSKMPALRCGETSVSPMASRPINTPEGMWTMNKKDSQMEVADMAAMARALELRAKFLKEEKVKCYVHMFKEPWPCGDRTYDRLTFDWTRLTGYDSLSIEMDLRRQGITLIVPAFTGDYLAGMAARACVERKNDKGEIVIRTADIKALPMSDFLDITARARDYLLHKTL